ncbi:MAG: hypothetical protein P8I99_08315 [Acidimicrobiales bacterium]|nr:hypothetical protein [Acidimicrobiales bacterium]
MTTDDPPRRSLRIIGLTFGFALLVGIAWWGAASIDLKEVAIAPAVVLLVAALMTLAIVAAELRVIASMLDTAMSLSTAMRVTVIGSAANILPLPGSSITRVVALRRPGVSVAAISTALIGAAAVWFGMALLVMGASAASTGPVPTGIFAVTGIGTVGTGSLLLRRIGAMWSQIGRLLVVEVLLTLVGVARLTLAVAALGLEGSFGEAAGVAAAGPASAAVAFVPAGLGVREALAAALGAISGLGAATAAVAATFDRALGLAVLAPTYLFVARRHHIEPAP